MYANLSLQRITGTVVPVRITNVIVQIPIPKAIIIAIVQVATDAYKSLIIFIVSRLVSHSRGRAPTTPLQRPVRKTGTVAPVRRTNVIVQIPIPKAIKIAIEQEATEIRSSCSSRNVKVITIISA